MKPLNLCSFVLLLRSTHDEGSQCVCSSFSCSRRDPYGASSLEEKLCVLEWGRTTDLLIFSQALYHWAIRTNLYGFLALSWKLRSKVDGGLYSLFGALCSFGRKPKSHPYGQGGGKPKRIDIFFLGKDGIRTRGTLKISVALARQCLKPNSATFPIFILL